jgi:hypothetical protein
LISVFLEKVQSGFNDELKIALQCANSPAST